jgi:hypothetical protein
MSRIFNGNAISSMRNMHGANNNGNGNVLTEAVRDFYRFQILYTRVFEQLSIYLGYYNRAEYKELTILLNETKQKILLTDITNNLLYNNNTVTNLEGFLYNSSLFTLYKTTTINILNGLVAAIEYNEQKVIIEDLNVELLKYKASIDASGNQQFILQYMNDKKLDLKPFELEMNFPPNGEVLYVELKPWYTKYLVEYGPPSNGVFDLNLLSQIVDTLIKDGVITLEEFISTL